MIVDTETEAALRARFEKLSSDSYGLRRSRRGTYVNGAVARDWKWFRLGASTTAAAPTDARPWHWIWDFLDGSAGYMGVFFGDKHPDKKGAFWWRADLKAALADIDVVLARRASAQAVPPVAPTDAKLKWPKAMNAEPAPGAEFWVGNGVEVGGPHYWGGGHWDKAALGAGDCYASKVEAVAAHSAASAQASPSIPPALRDVVAERQRQITGEGWTPEHDDVHDTGQVALAAACYAAHSASCAAIRSSHSAPGVFVRTRSAQDFVAEMWPWSSEWWKPSGHRRNLVKAGALILAEIERLDRAALKGNAS